MHVAEDRKALRFWHPDRDPTPGQREVLFEHYPLEALLRRVIRNNAGWVALTAVFASAGCGSPATHVRTEPSSSVPASPLAAKETVVRFLYRAERSRDCVKLWAPHAQAQCSVVLRHIVAARRRGEIPKVPAREYEISQGQDGTVTIDVGNRQPTPANPPDIAITFQLRRFHNQWRITDVG